MNPRNRFFLTGPLLPLTAMLLCFLVSLLLYLLFPPPTEGRIFLYPMSNGSGEGAERRVIPRRHDSAEQIAVFLDELFIGPVTMGFARVAPREMTTRHVAVIGSTVYADLDGSIINSEQSLSLKETFDAIYRNILFSFPRIDEIVLSIEGQQIYAPIYAGDSGSDSEKGQKK